MIEFPRKGDVIIADAEPHAGTEMGGHNPKQGNIRRHYVVMSNTPYNRATRMFIGMPITTTNHAGDSRFMPILINGSRGDGVKGYVVLWQLQNFDFVARHGRVVNRVNDATLRRLQRFVDDMVSK